MGITYSSPRITITGGNDTGTATSGTASTLTNTSKSWTTNAYAGRAVWIHTGTGAGQVRRISSNTATVLTVAHNFTTTPDSTSQYVVLYNLADIQAADTAGGWGKVTTVRNQVLCAADIRVGDGSTKSGLFDYQKDLNFYPPSTVTNPSFPVETGAMLCFGEEDVNGNPLNGCRLYFDWSLYSGGSQQGFGGGSSGGSVYFYDSLITVIPPTGNYAYLRPYAESRFYGNTFSRHTGMRPYSALSKLKNNTVHDGAVQSFSFGATPAEASGFKFFREDKALKSYSSFSFELLNATFSNNNYDFYLGNQASLSAIITATDCTHDGAGLVADAKIFVEDVQAISGGLKEKKRVRLILRDAADAAIQSARVYLKNTSGTEIINTTTDASGTHTITSVEVTNRTGYPLVKTSYNPFEFRYRLYGYVFASESATINAPLIDVIKRLTTNAYVVASDATVTAYTGVTINGSAKTIVLSGARTVQEMYDYSQAWGDDSGNIQYDESLTTTDGVTFNIKSDWVLTPAGNLTYTGKRIAGGTIANGTTGTWSPNLGTTTVRFTAAGTYVMSAADITGTVTFTNTSGGAVTVELDSSVDYVNSGPNITVQLPVEYQSVTVTGFTAGSRVQIYDVTNSVELCNGTASNSASGTGKATGSTVISGSTATWTDNVAASTSGSRAIRVRVSYVSGATAKEFIETSGLTCGTATGNKDISYPVTSTDDAVYNANAVDGSAVTGVTFTDTTVDVMNINISAGDTDLADLYAAWVYYAFTETGIATDIDYISAIDTANYVYSNLVWKNTTSPSVPLKISGGYAWDSVTGDPMDLIDTTGGTIFLAPPHVVAKTITVTGGNVVTGDIADITIPSTTDIANAVWSKTLP